jgi:predicted DNA-binding transcriptional regulator AlpA
MISFDTDKLADVIAEKVLRRIAAHVSKSDPLLPRREAAKYIGVSVTTFKRLETSPGFPMPQRPNGGHPRWLSSRLDAWKLRAD